MNQTPVTRSRRTTQHGRNDAGLRTEHVCECLLGVASVLSGQGRPAHHLAGEGRVRQGGLVAGRNACHRYMWWSLASWWVFQRLAYARLDR